MKDIRSLLRLHEDERSKPYRCSAGKLTIGVGRNLDDVGLSKDEIALLFENDLRRVELELHREFPWITLLDPVRYAVMVDMLFNLGLRRFKGFRKFIAAMAKGNWTVAAAEMQDSRWWHQVKTRAVRLQKMVLTGAWPNG